MTAKEAAGKVNSKYPNKTARKAFRFKGGFLILAPEKSTDGEDFNNPYFFVASDGSIRGYSPLEDLDAFTNLTEVPIN